MLRKKHSDDRPTTTGITTAIHLLTAVIIISRHLRLIILTLAAISIALAAYDFMTGNTGWGVVETVLAFGGIILLVQLKHKR
jgi:hypothetical protein